MQALDLWRASRLPNSLFRDFWGALEESEKASVQANRVPEFSLACDITDTSHGYQLSFDVPGLKKDEISIEMNGNRLTVSGERKRKEERQEGKYFRSELTYGKFTRTFELPEGTNAEAVEASYEHGVLSLFVPKAEQTKAKKISIQDGAKGFLKNITSKLDPTSPN